jgi:hypothetical protein
MTLPPHIDGHPELPHTKPHACCHHTYLTTSSTEEATRVGPAPTHHPPNPNVGQPITGSTPFPHRDSNPRPNHSRRTKLYHKWSLHAQTRADGCANPLNAQHRLHITRTTRNIIAPQTAPNLNSKQSLDARSTPPPAHRTLLTSTRYRGPPHMTTHCQAT